MTELNLTVSELLKVVEGDTSLNPSFLLRNLAAVEKAGACDLVVVFDPEDNSVFAPLARETIEKSKAALFLASRPVVDGKNYLLVKDPLAAFEKLTKVIRNKHLSVAQIHSSAVINTFAVVEDRVTVGAYAVICEDAKIGQGSVIGEHVFIGAGCVIGCDVIIYPGVKILDRCVVGDNSIIHSGAVIGSDGFGYRAMKTGLRKVPHAGVVRIGKDVEIGANVAIDRSEFGATEVGDGVKIDNHVHIAHNVKIGAHSAILAQTGIAGSVVIGMGCQIGGQVAIKDHLSIGNGVKIVSKSAVMKNLNDGEVVCGIPAVPFAQWKRQVVASAQAPDALKQVKEVIAYVEVARKKRSFWSSLFRWW